CWPASGPRREEDCCMSNEDLLKMLDLGGEEAPPQGEALPITAGGGETTAPASPTALRLDAWGLRRGEDVLRESERLPQCLADGCGGEVGGLRVGGRAVAGGSKGVEEAREAAAAVGLGPGSAGGSDARAVAAVLKRVRSDPTGRGPWEVGGRSGGLGESRQGR